MDTSLYKLSKLLIADIFRILENPFIFSLKDVTLEAKVLNGDLIGELVYETFLDPMRSFLRLSSISFMSLLCYAIMEIYYLSKSQSLSSSLVDILS